MNLLIDIGNTRLKVGVANDQGQRHPTLTTALAHSQLDQLPQWLATHAIQPKRAWAISVASTQLALALEQLLSTYDCSVQWLDATSTSPLLVNHYEQPERLGADRWLAALGIQYHHGAEQRPLVHASFGTATTVDTLLPAAPPTRAAFIGGLILPGPKLMHQTLANHTAQLTADLGQVQSFPTQTASAISSGVAAAQAGAVLRQWQRSYELRLGTPILVCSGGGWPLVQEELTHAYAQLLSQLQLATEALVWQPTPVLDGLAHLLTHSLSAPAP